MMHRITKYTYEEVVQIAKENGFEVLSKEYKQVHALLDVKCIKCGYEHTKSFSNLRKRGCPKCAGKISCTLQEVKNICRNNGFLVLSREYHNVDHKLEAQCMECGKIHKRSFYNIREGHGCDRCSGVERYSLEQAIMLAKENNLLLLEKEYINKKIPMEVKCVLCGFEYKKTLSDIIEKTTCINCGKKRKYSYEEICSIMNEHNYKVLSKKQHTSSKSTKIKCKTCGYIFRKNVREVLIGQKCPKCIGYLKPTIQEVKLFVENSCFILLSKRYKNAHAMLKVKCTKCNKTQKKAYKWIKDGHGCRYCSKIGKTQEKLFNVIKRLFPGFVVYNNYNKFEWLKTKRGGRQHIDIYIPAIKLAIEYNGIQHFSPTFVKIKCKNNKTADKKFKYQQMLDAEKKEKINNNKNDIKTFIEFNYKEKITKEYVIKKLKEFGIL